MKWLGHEVDHSPLSGVEVKNDGALPSLPLVFEAWHLIKYRDDFSFTYTEKYTLLCVLFV
jgi:hypothetical protein